AAIAPATVHLLVSRELDGSAALRTCTSRKSSASKGNAHAERKEASRFRRQERV
ncbi:MAG: hypothetical protein K0Q89_1391, partial [Thermomicrobiales bacterium]|nr:hypothetical protein [Thermomicrobiales bacterium]